MFICVLCFLLFALPFDTSASYFKSCVTPDGERGTCIGVTHCNRINQIYQKPEQLKQHEIDFLRLSHESCDSKYLVCCQLAISANDNDAINIVRKRRAIPEGKVEDFPLPKDCGIQADTDRIINGMVANIDEHPWMALLKYKTAQGVGYACAGTLISKRYILTAAHCVVGQFGAPVEVTLGEFDISTAKDCQISSGAEDCMGPPQMIAIEEVIKHPEYIKDGNRLHDIALLRLASECHYTDFVKPICVPNQTDVENVLKHSESMEICGWGRTKFKKNGSNVKRKALIPYVDRASCSKNRTLKIAESQVCAGGGTRDTCTGDSGGPLMGIHSEGDTTIRTYAVGIVSYGPKECGVLGIPAVYTNVEFYRDWIIKSIRP